MRSSNYESSISLGLVSLTVVFCFLGNYGCRVSLSLEGGGLGFVFDLCLFVLSANR